MIKRSYTFKDRNIGRVASSMEAERRTAERIERHHNTHHCIHCDHCELEPVLEDPEDYGIITSDEPVSKVIDVTLSCPVGEVTTDLRRKVVCLEGNNRRVISCADCRYGREIRCQMRSDSATVKVYTQMYACTNPQTAGQYPKGTVRRSYVGCANYTPKT